MDLKTHISTSFLRALLALLMVMLISAAVYGQTSQGFLGSWTQEDKPETTWTFRADGTGFMECSAPRSTARFTWVVKGKSLLLTTTGTEVSYSVLEQSSRELQLRSHYSGKTYRLVRASSR